MVADVILIQDLLPWPNLWKYEYLEMNLDVHTFKYYGETGLSHFERNMGSSVILARESMRQFDRCARINTEEFF